MPPESDGDGDRAPRRRRGVTVSLKRFLPRGAADGDAPRRRGRGGRPADKH